jgi:hypothetical protein
MKLRCGSEGPFMRVVDSILDPEKAAEVPSQMYDLIKSSYRWEQPDRGRHLNAFRRPPDDEEESRKHPDESNKEYSDRMNRRSTWPERSTASDAEWIWRAQVVIRSLGFLLEKSGGYLEGLGGTREYSFRRKDFYEYAWICFREGVGVRLWKISPKLPPPDLSIEDKAQWFYKKALQTEEKILTDWYEGKTLETITGEWTLDDVWEAAPY